MVKKLIVKYECSNLPLPTQNTNTPPHTNTGYSLLIRQLPSACSLGFIALVRGVGCQPYILSTLTIEEYRMSFVLNQFLERTCVNKLGFQSSNVSDKTAQTVVDTLARIQAGIDSGKIKDGSIIVTYSKVNITKPAVKNAVVEMEVDGEMLSIGEMEAADAKASEDAPPF
mgnify:FL=1